MFWHLPRRKETKDMWKTVDQDDLPRWHRDQIWIITGKSFLETSKINARWEKYDYTRCHHSWMTMDKGWGFISQYPRSFFSEVLSMNL